MGFAVDRPWLLLLLLFCLPALRGRNADWRPVASLLAVPVDAASRGLDAVLRFLAAAAVAGIALGLAGLHQGQQTVLRSGTGAHIVLVLDRSLSMDEPFALKGQPAHETKTAATARLVADFLERRPHDSVGLVAFSTAPIVAMPLTAHREAILAAVAAMHEKGLSNTDIGGGLATALHIFGRDDVDATRVILLVSDGAGVIDQKVQDYIRAEALRQHAHIYYLYLRAGDEPPLAEDIVDRNDSTHPAALDSFLRSLGIPYRGFEAADPGAVAAATDTIGRLETHRFLYKDTLPRIDEDAACYAVAAVCLALVLLARLAERDFPLARRSVQGERRV